MKRSYEFIGVFVGMALLAACGEGNNGLSSSAPFSAASSIAALRIPAPGSAKGDLLYVDQGFSVGHNRGVVAIYSYPGDKFVAKFTVANPSYPPATTEGICSDTLGDVFIEAEYYYGTTIYEYAHGGTSPIATIADGGNGYVNECASDPTTGNLAVVSRASPGSGQANVAIFKDAMGTPTIYTDPSISDYYSCSYDNQGNLFIEGTATSGHAVFAELPLGSGTFTNITLGKPSKYLGAVQWDGSYITLQEGLKIYRLSISGSKGTVVGTTQIRRRDPSKGYEYIYRGRVIAPDGAQHKDGRIGFWRYPSGGDAVNVIADDGILNLYSETISVAPSH